MTKHSPDCLHCRVGMVLKTYLEEKLAAGNDADRGIDNVMQNLTHVVTDVLQQVQDVRARNILALEVVREIMTPTVLASLDELLGMSEVKH